METKAEKVQLIDAMRTEKEIEKWLVNKFKHWTGLSEDEIDLEQPFADFALDSSVAVSITGELSRWCGKELPITLLWEFPTISALSGALASPEL